MRILGFQKKWDKLNKDVFTTFRFERGDKDWFTGEKVQVLLKPRSKQRQWLFNALIITKEARQIDKEYPNKRLDRSPFITEAEAIEDGFTSLRDMQLWLLKTYGYTDRLAFREPINKLTLKRLKE